MTTTEHDYIDGDDDVCLRRRRSWKWRTKDEKEGGEWGAGREERGEKKKSQRNGRGQWFGVRKSESKNKKEVFFFSSFA